MAEYNHKIDFITIQIIEFLKTNEIDIDRDEDLDIISKYLEKNFRIKLGRKALSERAKKII